MPRCLQYQCSPQFVNRALHPLIQHLENSAGLTHEDPQSSKLGKLSNWLTSITGNEEGLPLLAALLSIEVIDRGALADMSAPLQRKLTFELLTRLMWPRTTDDPVLVVFEDVHWADPTTQEFLSELVPLVAASRSW